MFLKSLKIFKNGSLLRDIVFHNGINLIVDETPVDHTTKTGNNVGKTTVLKLIDFCLAGKPKIIYTDPESKKNEYKLVKNFLIEQNVLIELILKEDLDNEHSKEIVIERNFLARNKIIRKINNESYTESEFELKLLELIFPNQYSDKPTFRQIISHNIRFKEESLNKTLRTLDSFTTDVEYETLHLFLFGCDYSKGNEKQEIIEKIKQEINFKNRLENNQTKTFYETALNIIDDEIEKLDRQKKKFNFNETLEQDIEKLNTLKFKINGQSSTITNLSIKKNLILEAENDILSNKSEIDVQQLQIIYQQAISQIDTIQKTFEDLVNFHNSMITEKVNFITKELPEIDYKLKQSQKELKELLTEEEAISIKIAKSDSFEELEEIITLANDNFRKKGEYENIIKQIEQVENNLEKYQKELDIIDDELFSSEFEQIVKKQLKKFNTYYSTVSQELYGEKYAIKHDVIVNTKNQKLYKFTPIDINYSSGKKQGEISCFDIAYILFADSENMPCLHFILNDKKELMHDNQLVKIAEFANKHKIQFVASILRDKLPNELDDEHYIILKLSQDEKLFKIENYYNEMISFKSK